MRWLFCVLRSLYYLRLMRGLPRFGVVACAASLTTMQVPARRVMGLLEIMGMDRAGTCIIGDLSRYT
jgi:hypothetical protein